MCRVGLLEDAEHNLIRALELDPDFELAMAALGYVHRRMGDELPAGMDRDQMHNKAEKFLLEALNRSPKLVDDDNKSWWGSLGGAVPPPGTNRSGDSRLHRGG